MRVIRRPAVQGHAIPTTAHRPNGPFPPELLAPNEVVQVEVDEPDPWANAQNNYTPPRWLRCRGCGEIMPEDDSQTHVCGTSWQE